ncbi:MAG: hypothetical protein FWG99_10910 [Treponema sp.]|nr:hypothetical protein [Treponema sp.]
MKRSAWNKFIIARDRYRLAVEEITGIAPNLAKFQQKLADGRTDKGGAVQGYKVETPVVYNRALDEITVGDEIRLILVADNPGRREQAAENRRYLVGPSGKIAEKFFNNNPALGIDFRKNTIILNKTPIHTPRTVELRELCRLEALTGKRTIEKALEESQRTMAALLLEFHKALYTGGDNDLQIWIIGYSEMKKGGIFSVYTDEVRQLYSEAGSEMMERLFLFRHFSMNQFTIDLNQQKKPAETTEKALRRIGSAYRQRILGF